MYTSYDQRKEYVLILPPLEGPKETIAYGGDTKGEVIGVGDIPISQNYSITNVLHVDPLGYNLLSVSQLSEIDFDCHFLDKGVSIIRREDSSIVLTSRLKGRLYLVDLNKSKVSPKTCLVAKSSMYTLRGCLVAKSSMYTHWVGYDIAD
jgi:hypothetical protein